MTSQAPSYHGYRFPPEIISYAVWLYYRFGLSFRDVEDLLAQRRVTVTYETIRQWCLTFGPSYARTLRRRRGRLGDTWHLDELFVTLNGRRQYLWRAVDEDGDVLDILVQSRRNRRAALRFFRKLLKRQGCMPRRLITDKLRSYLAAHRTVSRPSRTARISTPTIARRSPINRHGSANAKCAALNRPPTYSASRRYTASSRISSGSAGICCGRHFTVYCEAERSSNGRQ